MRVNSESMVENAGGTELPLERSVSPAGRLKGRVVACGGRGDGQALRTAAVGTALFVSGLFMISVSPFAPWGMGSATVGVVLLTMCVDRFKEYIIPQDKTPSLNV